MNNQSAEDYLDRLLNSVNNEDMEVENNEQNLVDEIVEDLPADIPADIPAEQDIFVLEKSEKMVSKRVSKSEDDFLKEFEKELEEDDYSDFLSSFDEDTAVFSDRTLDLDDITLEAMPTEQVPEVEQEVAPIMEEMSLEDLFAGNEPEVEQEAAPAMEEMSLEDLFAGNEPEVEQEAAPAMGEMSLEDLFAGNEPEETPATEESFSLGGIDLGDLIKESSQEEIAVTEAAPEEQDAPLEMDDADMFASLFGEPSDSDTNGQENANSSDAAFDFNNLFGGDDAIEGLEGLENLGGNSSGGIDLGNLGEADLMSLLAGDDLGDIGDMLNASESGEAFAGELDAFESFAEGEMAAHSEDASSAKKAKGGAKAGGLLGKLSSILFGSDEDEDEGEGFSFSLKKKKAPNAESLSNENDAILASMEKEDKAKKKGKKEKAPKAKKEKKPKAPKVPKEKKPKKQKPIEIDNTPPLKKKPVILIVLMVASLSFLVMVGTKWVSYSLVVSQAKAYYTQGEYSMAYKQFFGVELDEKDMELYNQAATLATVDSELRAYKIFAKNDKVEEAVDSLISAAGRCEINAENAEIYGCEAQLETLKKEVTNELKEKYKISYKQAIELYMMKDRDDYTIALKKLLIEMGLSEL